MMRRMTFIALQLSVLGGLTFWSRHVQGTFAPPLSAIELPSSAPEISREIERRELVEVLDRIVAYERTYRSVYGHFTQFLNRVGFLVPDSLLKVYEIRVA